MSRALAAGDWFLRARRRAEPPFGCDHDAFAATLRPYLEPLAFGSRRCSPVLIQVRRASGDSFSIPKIRETTLRYLAVCPGRPVFQTTACTRPGTGGTRPRVPADRRLH